MERSFGPFFCVCVCTYLSVHGGGSLQLTFFRDLSRCIRLSCKLPVTDGAVTAISNANTRPQAI